MSKNAFSNNELRAFEKQFDPSYEIKAIASRNDFIRDFPLKRLHRLTVDDYTIGKGTPSFCAGAEAKTKKWARIQGSPARKFGIYFGRTKTDPTRRYRPTRKFGRNKAEAFREVKLALLDLVEAGKSRDFERIDENRLSQMFKAKLLSLYFKNSYLNVCSSEHLELLASKLGIEAGKYNSEYQHLLLQKKLENHVTRQWSNPKFMRFLYKRYFPKERGRFGSPVFVKPRKKAHRRVNFEDISANQAAVGKKSEEFALKWEKSRLRSVGHPELVAQLEDRRDRPSYGYDFLSHTSPGRQRYIEVKSAGRDKKGEGYRFYLSDNELGVSKSKDHRDEYYFYLVLYNNRGKPHDLVVKRAKELYPDSIINPCAYFVRFDLAK